MNIKKTISEEKYSILFIVTIFILYNFVIKTFIIPSESMTNTMKVGDYFLGKKFEYGLRIPEFFGTNIKMFPDINHNGYLILWKTPQRKDILIFQNPLTHETYIKRCFGISGDEILFKNDNQMYLHPKEGDEYIKQNYNIEKYIKYNNKLWVKNYIADEIKTIHYNENNVSTYNILTSLYTGTNNNTKFKEGNNWIKYLNFDKNEGIYTYIVPEGHYFVVGDNRDNSIDSRFFGAIPMSSIKAKPYKVLFNTKESGRAFINVR